MSLLSHDEQSLLHPDPSFAGCDHVSEPRMSMARRSEGLIFHAPDEVKGANAQKWWALRSVRAVQAWHLSPVKGEGQAILMTGAGCNPHPELEGDALLGSEARVETQAGTALATLAVSRQQGEIAGTAPGACLMSVRSASSTSLDELRAGVLLGAKPIAAKEVVDARSKGCIVILPAQAAVSNDPLTNHAFRVCAVDVLDQPLAGAREIGTLGCAAPGVMVWAGVDAGEASTSCAPVSGHAAAAAIVAGIAALWRAHHTDAALEQAANNKKCDIHALFQAAVAQTARCPNAWNEAEHGAGIIDAEALLRLPLDRIERVRDD